MTSLDLTMPERGPVTLDARTVSAAITVSVGGTDRARVTVQTLDTDGPSHDAVATARLENRAGRLVVHLDERGQAGVTDSVINVSGNGNSIAISGSIIGSNIQIGGGTMYGGMNVPGSAGAWRRSSPVTVHVELPAGSSVTAETVSGQVTVGGAVVDLQARTVSGDVTADQARSANVTTTSGRIRVARADRVSAQSVSGRIVLDRAEESAYVSTTSGDIDIDYAGPNPPSAHSVSGRVRLHQVRRRPR